MSSSLRQSHWYSGIGKKFDPDQDRSINTALREQRLDCERLDCENKLFSMQNEIISLRHEIISLKQSILRLSEDFSNIKFLLDKNQHNNSPQPNLSISSKSISSF